MGKAMSRKPATVEIPELESLPEGLSLPEVANDEPTTLETPAKSVVTAMVEVPLASVSGYVSMHLEIRFRPGEGYLAETLKRLHEGLYQRSEKLASGKHITSPADAIRWMLEQVALADAT